MKMHLVKSIKKASVYSKNEIVYKVNDQFLKLTGYKYGDIVGKSLVDLSVILRMDFQTYIQDIQDMSDLYIFTKEDWPKNVKITCKELTQEGIKVYYIEENLTLTLETLLCNYENIDINYDESIAIYSYPECIYLKANKRYLNNLSLIGIDTDDIIGKVPLFPKDILDILKKGKSFYKKEVKFQTLSNGTSYWDISVRAIFDDSNKRYLICFFYNVTKKVIERKIHERERIEMEEILNNTSDTIIKVNNKGQYTYINKIALDKKLEYNIDNMCIDNKRMFELFEYYDIDAKRLSFEDTPIEKVLRGERFTNYILVTTSPLMTIYHECSGAPIYDELGNIDGGVLVYRDIEDRLKIEEYYAFKNNIQHVYLNYAVLSCDDFRIKYINEAGFESIKKSRPYVNSVLELIGRDFFVFYKNKEELIGQIRQAIKEKTPYIDKQKFGEEKESKYMKTIFQPVFDIKGKIEKIIVIGIDITDEGLYNEEMANALKVQEEVFINTSHELKTPLNIIFSASQLLNVYLQKASIESNKDKIIYNNEIIIKNCYRLAKLISNILDFSKMESGFCQLNLSNNNIVKITKAIVDSVGEYTKSGGIQIIFDTEVEELIMAFDLYKFERILINLISNAIKFSKDNGIIIIKLLKKDSTVEISVKDNGIGIEKEKLNNIFEKFIQLNTSLNPVSGGTGIGLALVKSLVELHQGNISVESVPNQGSTFTVELPIRTIDNVETIKEQDSYMDKVEMIRFELSDIY